MARTILALLLSILWITNAQAETSLSAPSFIGCAADGMMGPTPAPSAPLVMPQVPTAAAAQLTYYYTAEWLAVLAPRGWHCIERYGSGGAVLLVTPDLYTMATLPDSNALSGPAIELNFINGENSGRFEVAEVFSRLFPFKREFLRHVAELFDKVPRYPRGPYPSDITVRRSRTVVDYTTSPHRDGMGTFHNHIKPGDSPIMGMAKLARSNGIDSVILLDVRLPPNLQALTPIILATARSAPSSAK